MSWFLDDEFATKLGIESLDKLKELIKDQIVSQYGQMTRQRVKRQPARQNGRAASV